MSYALTAPTHIISFTFGYNLKIKMLSERNESHGILRTKLGPTTDVQCMDIYFHNTKVYESMLHKNKMTMAEYQNIFDLPRPLVKTLAKTLGQDFSQDPWSRL